MYRLTFLLSLFLCMTLGTFAQSLFHSASTVSVTAPSKVAVSWEEEVFDFGEVVQGVPVHHTFTFTNNGNTPLVLEKVTPACGCTTLEYTEDAVLPGKQGVVKAQYNAAKVGYFNKSVSLKFKNDESFYYVKFKGEVVEE